MKSLYLASVFSLLAGGLSAQTVITDWTIDSGGGRSTGGVHVVTGSVGQPAGGLQRSASYQLAGGYFGLVAVVPTESAPTLRLVPTAREVILAWPITARGFQLEQTPDLARPDWSAVSTPAAVVGAEYQVRLPWQTGDRYFRLRQE